MDKGKGEVQIIYFFLGIEVAVLRHELLNGYLIGDVIPAVFFFRSGSDFQHKFCHILISIGIYTYFLIILSLNNIHDDYSLKSISSFKYLKIYNV